MTAKANAPTAISALAHAVESFERVVHELKDKKPAVFFDYDGTLTKIVEHPDLAVLSPSMRHSIGRLAGRTLTGIISGLDLDNVRNLVQKDKLLYAGSHGFDMFIPGQGRCEPHPSPLTWNEYTPNCTNGFKTYPASFWNKSATHWLYNTARFKTKTSLQCNLRWTMFCVNTPLCVNGEAKKSLRYNPTYNGTRAGACSIFWIFFPNSPNLSPSISVMTPQMKTPLPF
jgi:hypothetical protein